MFFSQTKHFMLTPLSYFFNTNLEWEAFLESQNFSASGASQWTLYFDFFSHLCHLSRLVLRRIRWIRPFEFFVGTLQTWVLGNFSKEIRVSGCFSKHDTLFIFSRTVRPYLVQLNSGDESLFDMKCKYEVLKKNAAYLQKWKFCDESVRDLRVRKLFACFRAKQGSRTARHSHFAT